MKTIYLDMDGVVADWNQGVYDILGWVKADANAHYDPKDWKKVTDNKRIYGQLPVMDKAEELANLARRFRDELGWQVLFLTAVPKGNDVHWAFWDKCQWAQKYFPDIPVHFGPFAKQKCEHCKTGDILVDDRRSNCSEWRDAGGIAIEVIGPDLGPAISELSQIFESFKVQKNYVD